MNRASPARHEHWRRIIDEQQRSGLSVAQFCRDREIGQASLFAWKRRLAREVPKVASPAFVLLKPTPAAASNHASDSAAAIELHLGHGRHLLLRPGFDASTLAAALAVLKDHEAEER